MSRNSVASYCCHHEFFDVSQYITVEQYLIIQSMIAAMSCCPPPSVLVKQYFRPVRHRDSCFLVQGLNARSVKLEWVESVLIWGILSIADQWQSVQSTFTWFVFIIQRIENTLVLGAFWDPGSRKLWGSRRFRELVPSGWEIHVVKKQMLERFSWRSESY